MSVSISSGGGGGGITIETDPTALKIANNLSDLTDAGQALFNLGAIADAPADGNTYGRLLGEWTVVGGGGTSFMVGGNGIDGFVNNVKLETGGSYNGSVELTNENGSSMRMVVGGLDSHGQIQAGLEANINENVGTFKYGYWGDYSIYGWKIDQPLIFSDGTSQTTAYTGGGGGGGRNYAAEAANAFACSVMAGSVVFWESTYYYGNWVGWDNGLTSVPVNNFGWAKPAAITEAIASGMYSFYITNGGNDYNFFQMAYLDNDGWVTVSDYSYMNTIYDYIHIGATYNLDMTSASSFAPVAYIGA